MQDASFLETTLKPYADTMKRVMDTLAPGRPFRAGLEDLLAALAEHLHFDHPHIVVQDPESGNLRLSLAYGQAGSPGAVYAPGRGITGQVFATGRPIIVERMESHPDFRNRLFERSAEEMASHAFLCVPLFAGGSGDHDREPIGTLSVDTPLASPARLRLRCGFLEMLAALIGNQVAYLQEELARQHFQLGQDDGGAPGIPFIISQSKSMQRVLRQALRVGPSRATVLLRGESGTGKELMAEAIHRSSTRNTKPFVKFNCAALPAELLEGELFGWRKGAFTNACQNRRGVFEQADGGTLFLDEIGDLSLQAQAKVLRAIQEQEIRCLGSEHAISVDVRLVCATNRPLEQMVEQGLFREDLYYRINVFPLFLPPLRERRDDIIPLADHFLEHFSREHGRNVQRISTPAIDILIQYHWPGNVRELKNCMERAVLLCEDGVIRAHHFPPSLQTGTSTNTLGDLAAGFTEKVNMMERELIVEALKHTRGNIHKAARFLKITYRVIYYKIQKYNIDYKRYVVRDQDDKALSA